MRAAREASATSPIHGAISPSLLTGATMPPTGSKGGGCGIKGIRPRVNLRAIAPAIAIGVGVVGVCTQDALPGVGHAVGIAVRVERVIPVGNLDTVGDAFFVGRRSPTEPKDPPAAVGDLAELLSADLSSLVNPLLTASLLIASLLVA